MAKLTLNDLEIAPAEVVRQAASDFAAALAETTEYRAYERAEAQLRDDSAAQATMQAFKKRQADLEVLLALGAASPEEQAELERLREAFLSAPSVVAFLQAQAELQVVCQAAGDVLSQATGLDFAAACRTGCC
jgi:cell fate (sporulation/competence/biofilm development) regulator YlbF (YheA/YmcA/DUF963 family)